MTKPQQKQQQAEIEYSGAPIGLSNIRIDKQNCVVNVGIKRICKINKKHVTIAFAYIERNSVLTATNLTTQVELLGTNMLMI